MPEFPIPYDAARGHSMTRAAEAFLRSLGGGSVLLRLPVGVQPGSSDLGLASPLIEEVVLEPAVVRAISSGPDAGRVQILLSAAAVQAQIELRGYASADALFAAALGLVLAGKLYRIANVSADSFAGAAYLYRVTATP